LLYISICNINTIYLHYNKTIKNNIMKKTVTITMNEDVQTLAKENSKKVFGSVNLSAYLSYLIKKDKQ